MPERPISGGHTPLRPQRDPDAGTYLLLSPAALSAVREIVDDSIDKALSDRSTAAESALTLQVESTVRSKTKRYRGAVSGLAAALVAVAGWAVAEVRSYGDERVAAYTAQVEARDAKAHAEETRQVADRATARLDELEPKVDEALVILRELHQQIDQIQRSRSVPVTVTERRPNTIRR